MIPHSPYLRDQARGLREPGISRLSKVPIVECGEPLVDIREACPGVHVSAPLPWARERVASMLSHAARALPSGLALLVTTAMRTMDMQAAGYTSYRESLRQAHPEWPVSTLNREANRFFHPPHAKAPPGHTTGGAVDVRLLADGKEVDLWSSQPGTSTTTWRTFHRGITPQAREGRAILYDAMVSAGFSNCYDEWWHYSYGDNGWACRLEQPHAIYGQVAEEDYPPTMRAAVEELRRTGALTRLMTPRHQRPRAHTWSPSDQGV